MARDLSVALAIPMHFDAIRGNDRTTGGLRPRDAAAPPGGLGLGPGIGAGLVWPALAPSWHDPGA